MHVTASEKTLFIIHADLSDKLLIVIITFGHGGVVISLGI